MTFDRHMGKANGMPRLRASSMEELDHVRIHSHCDLLMLDRGCQKGDSAVTVRLGNAHGRLRRFREPLPDIQSGEDGTLVLPHAAQAVGLVCCLAKRYPLPIMIDKRHRSLAGQQWR